LKLTHFQALAPRANLISTISRSLDHAAGMKATSNSLSNKLKELSETLVAGIPEDESIQASSAYAESQRLTSYIVDRLWLHLQKNLTTRSTPSLQAVVHQKAEVKGPCDSDELLELANRQNKASDVVLHTTNEDETKHSVDLNAKQDGNHSRLSQTQEQFFGDHELTYPAEAIQDELLLDATSPNNIVNRKDTGFSTLCSVTTP
jgi:hypothetical protein